MDWKKELNRLQRLRRRALGMGGPERVERQHKLGKLTARERIDRLIDPGTFVEYGMLATFFGQSPEADRYAAADAVVAGFGKIDGRACCIIAEDFTVQGGSLGVSHFNKKMRILARAGQEKTPVILLLDGGGARAEQETVEGMPYAPHHARLARLSGLVPIISCALGPCAGDSSLLGSLSEFIIMVEGISMFGIAGPPVVESATSEKISKEEMAGSKVHCYETGVADNEATSEEHCFQLVREYLSYFPSNCWEEPPWKKTSDDPNRRDEELISIVPENYLAPYDMKKVIQHVVDEGYFFEIRPFFAKNVITCLARMDGHPVGMIANQPKVLAGALTAKAAHKARHFIEICDSFHIPLIFLADCPGVMPGYASEREGTLRLGLTVAYASAFVQVPTITVVLRKAFGFGGTSMGAIGSDQALIVAWPSANFASLPARGGVAASRAREIAVSDDPEKIRQELIRAHEEKEGPFLAAGSFRIDDVIDPRETRPLLVKMLELGRRRRIGALGPRYKYGIMP